MIYGKTHVARLKVTFDLLDAGNVVYHPNYLILCEQARAEAFAAASYSLTDLWGQGIALAVREGQAEFLRPIRMTDQISIFTRLEEFSGASLKVRQCIVEADEDLGSVGQFLSGALEDSERKVFFQASLRLVSVKFDGIKTVRLPETLKTALQLPQ